MLEFFCIINENVRVLFPNEIIFMSCIFIIIIIICILLREQKIKITQTLLIILWNVKNTFLIKNLTTLTV